MSDCKGGAKVVKTFLMEWNEAAWPVSFTPVPPQGPIQVPPKVTLSGRPQPRYTKILQLVRK